MAGPSVSRRGWLTRNLVVLSGVSLLQDSASELVYPVLPIFLTGVLGAPVAVVGLVEGVAEGGASLAKVGSGVLADRYRRRPLIALGYGMAALGKLLVAVAGAWPAVLAGRVVDRLGKGVRGAPRDALITEGIPPSARGRAFGLHRAADTLGAVIGPLLGLAVYELAQHEIRTLLAVAVVPAVLSVLLVGAARERYHAAPPGTAAPPRTAGPAGTPVAGTRWPARWTAGLPGRYWRVVVLLAGFSLVNFPDALLLLRLNQIGFSVTALILAYVTYNLVYAVASFPAGVLADRIPRHRVWGIGLVFFAVGYLGLGLVHDQVIAWLLLAAYGLFAAFTDGVSKAWVSALVDGPHQARAQGVAQGATGFGVLVAGVWAGVAWGQDGRWPLLVSGGVAGVIAVGLLLGPSRAWVSHSQVDR